MRKSFLTVGMLIASSFVFTSCEPSSNNANRAANASTVNTANTANTSGNSAAAEADIKKLMDTAQAALAKNDADAMEKIYADNYTLINLDGSVQNKAERLAALRSGDAKYTAFSYSEPNIRVNPEGNGAVVIVKLAMKGAFRGKATDGDYRVMQVYSKTKDGWKQVGAQATLITAASAPAAATTANGPATNSPANANRY